MNAISLVFLIVIAVPMVYLLLLAAASLQRRPPVSLDGRTPRHRFIIAIPAHDEGSVIERTVARLLQLDYPAHLFSVHVVADHCSDDTAALARRAGAVVHERREAPRSGKGAALSWLFQRVLAGDVCDAVVVFDADTQVAADFLRVMDARLDEGHQVIQGQHVISNPEAGWFPALVWAMFLVDNRYQNLGRCNLGWSAKNMGDSICFRSDVLRRLGWGEGLTEDYQLRQRLLLNGIRIVYEPAAIGRGESPASWAQARAQRARWLRGIYDVGQRFARRLLLEAVRRRDLALLDGALQAYLPVYSTLAVIAALSLLAHVVINIFVQPLFSPWLIAAWGVVVSALIIYPLAGLAVERASSRAYAAILLGPFFIVWRTWLMLIARFGSRPVIWVRTSHGQHG